MNVTSANSAVRDLNVDVCLFPRLDFGEFLPDHFALGGVFVQTHPSLEFVVGCCCHDGGGGSSSIGIGSRQWSVLSLSLSLPFCLSFSYLLYISSLSHCISLNSLQFRNIQVQV